MAPAQCSFVVFSFLCWIILGCLTQPGRSVLVEPLPDWDATHHPCDRPCRLNESPRTCEYHFVIEWYLTLSKACHDCPFNMSHCSLPHCVPGDGLRKPIITTNRKMPGPAIQVCEGDNIDVTVTNDLGNGEATTIHWHGVHQRGTPYMDGTNLVTQCPISQGASFKYEFVAEPAGTHFWHSHTGFQRGDGLQGAFIVRSPPEHEPHYNLYDHDCGTQSKDCEYIIVLTDWLDETANSRFVYLMHHLFDIFLPSSSLMNGKNRKLDVTNVLDPTQVEKTPWEVFDVLPNKRYRFRVISSANMICPFKIAVVGHQVAVIAADGRPVEPVQVDTFLITPGERYDFILTTDQTVNNYWIQAFGAVDCAFTRADVFGIVRYQGAALEEPQTDRMEDRTGRLLNPVFWQFKPDEPKNSHGASDDILIYQLNSTERHSVSHEQVDVRFYLGFNFNNNDNTKYNNKYFYPVEDLPPAKAHFTPVINNITFLVPPSPILSQAEDLDSHILCDSDTVNSSKCLTELCMCTHLVKVPLDKVVELVMVNEGVPIGSGHPMHIHGYSFRIISSGKLGKNTTVQEVREKWESNSLPVNLDAPSYRDTVWVEVGGYVVARFKASNPGFWLFHCHVESHAEQGQAMIFQIGDSSEMPPVPPGFPKCGNWAPGTKQSEPKKCENKPPYEKSGASVISGYVHVVYVFMVVTILNMS